MGQFLGFGNSIDGIKTVSGTEDVNTRVGVNGSNASGQKVLNVDSTTGFVAGDMILIHKSRGNTTTNAGNWELNQIVSVGSGLFNLLYNLSFTYNDDGGTNQAQVVKVRQYSKLTVPVSQTIAPASWDGNVGGITAILVSGEAVIAGSINGEGRGFRGGNGNNNSNSTADSGEGTAGASVVGSSAPNGNGGGGGNVGPGGANTPPSGGSNGTQGTGSNPGATVGSADLTVANFGGGGGGKGMDSPTANTGSPGGSFIMLFASKLTITGTINNNGTNAQTNSAGGGGGSTFLKSKDATLGTNLVTATGGTGGNNQGGAGRIRAELCKVTGTTNPSLSQVVGGHAFCGVAGVGMM